MIKASKLLLGLIALAVGTGLLFSSGSALADGWMTGTRSGIPLGSLSGVAIALMAIGASWDLLGPPRAPAPKKETIAQSIWASRAHVDEYGIGES